MEMKGLFLSFVVGLGVGVLYGLIRVKSPAPDHSVARLVRDGAWRTAGDLDAD